MCMSIMCTSAQENYIRKHHHRFTLDLDKLPSFLHKLPRELGWDVVLSDSHQFEGQE
jgi:hypothetical protein